MTQRKRRWLWTTVGAVALLSPTPGTQAATAVPESGLKAPQAGEVAGHWRMAAGEKGERGERGEGGERGERGEAGERGTKPASQAKKPVPAKPVAKKPVAPAPVLAKDEVGERVEGGEAGESGGESGERGIDPARAAKDPVAFITSLDVIRAHYLAGKDAYAGGHKDAAAEMFVHPIGEVYVDLEEVFKQRGVKPFDELMSKAGEAGGGTDAKAVTESVDAVLAAVDAAAQKAPAPGEDDARVNALILADLIDRAAALYNQALKETEGEAYLDGYGFYKAASVRAGKRLETVGKKSPGTAKDINAALDVLDKAYPSATRPTTMSVKAGDVLAAASRVALSAGSVK